MATSLTMECYICRKVLNFQEIGPDQKGVQCETCQIRTLDAHSDSPTQPLKYFVMIKDVLESPSPLGLCSSLFIKLLNYSLVLFF